MVRNKIKRADLALQISIWLLLTLGALLTAASVGARYESRLLPVVPDFRVERIDDEGARVSVSGAMTKRRDCRFVGLNLYVGDPDDPDSPRERLRFRFLDTHGDGSPNRLPGAQGWGPWLIEKPTRVLGPVVFMRVIHVCHPLYDTSSVIVIGPATEMFGPGYG